MSKEAPAVSIVTAPFGDKAPLIRLAPVLSVVACICENIPIKPSACAEGCGVADLPEYVNSLTGRPARKNASLRITYLTQAGEWKPPTLWPAAPFG